jgi:adenylate cyclase
MKNKNWFWFLLSIFFSFLLISFLMLYREYSLYFNKSEHFLKILPEIKEHFLKKFEIGIQEGSIFISTEIFFTFLLFISFSLIFYLLINYAFNFKIFSQRKIIQKAFLHYVSPSIVKNILDRPETLTLGGKSSYLTVCFIDIVNFSTLVSEYHPKDLVKYLNEYFSEMSEIIIKNEGTIDKYEGDAVMAFWGAPLAQDNHTYLACKTALILQKVLKKFRKTWKRMNRPEIFAKIGIVSGDMLVGNIGSKGHFNYTVIGEPVNQCAHLEKLNRIYNTNILVGEDTYHKTKHDFEYREINNVFLKGSKKSLRIFELLEEKGKLNEIEKELRNSYQEALKFKSEKKDKKALEKLYNCLRINPNDKASKLLKEEILEKNPDLKNIRKNIRKLK